MNRSVSLALVLTPTLLLLDWSWSQQRISVDSVFKDKAAILFYGDPLLANVVDQAEEQATLDDL